MRKLTIRQWRRMKELSQADMAYKLGIHANTYRHIEMHPTETKLITLFRICRILKIDINDIKLSDDDEEETEERGE